MLVVISIIGLIAATSIPAFAKYGQQMRLRTTTQEVAGLLSLARQLAISSRQERTVLIDPEAREVVIEETLEEDEPKRVRVGPGIEVQLNSADQSEAPWRVVFEPSGGLGSRSATVVVSSKDRQKTITVVAATGGVSVK